MEAEEERKKNASAHKLLDQKQNGRTGKTGVFHVRSSARTRGGMLAD